MDGLSSMGSAWQHPMTFTQRQKRETAAVKQMTKRLKNTKQPTAHQHHGSVKGRNLTQMSRGDKGFFQTFKENVPRLLLPIHLCQEACTTGRPSVPTGEDTNLGKWLHFVTGAAFERLPGWTILGGKGVRAGTPSRGLQEKRIMNLSTVEVRCLVRRGKSVECITFIFSHLANTLIQSDSQ